MSRSALIVATWVAMAAGSMAVAAGVTHSGKVVDEAGEPLAGVTVQVFHIYGKSEAYFDIRTAGSVTTDADGRFAVADTPEQQATLTQGFLIVAKKEGLALGWVMSESGVSMFGEGGPVTITLGKPTTMAGVVLDETGAPIEGAVVGGFFIAGAIEEMRAIFGLGPIDAAIRKTNARGKFSFDDLPADAKGEFIVSSPGKATLVTFQPTDGMPGQYPPGKTDIRLILQPEGRVEGKVIDKVTGKPVAGVKIKAVAANNSMPFGETVVSDAEGKFAIGGLTSVGHRLHAMLDPAKHAGFVAGEAIVDVMGGETTSDVVIQLFKGGVLEVVVTDEKDGSPVKTALVQVTSDEGRQPVSGTTDDKGIASISVSPGDYTVQMVYAMPLYGMLQPNESVTVAAGKTARVEVKLEPAPKIAGTVRDPEGKPVEGAVLQVTPLGGQTCTSNVQGKFEMSLQPQSFGGGGDMVYMLVGRHVDRDLAMAIEIDPEATDSLDIKLEPGITIFGMVRDAQDKPIANATVQVVLRSSSYSASLLGRQTPRTDAEGCYEVKAIPPDQKIRLTARASDFGQADVEVDLLDADDRRVEVEQITLQVANMSISGTVVDEDDKPVAEAFVHTYGQGQASRQAQTDKDGKFTIEKLCEGLVQISVNASTPTQMFAAVSAQAGDKDIKIVVADQTVQRRVVPPAARSLLGKPLPGLTKLNVDVETKDLEGQAVLVGFFDVRQRPSRHFLKKLAARAEELQGQGLAIIIVQAAPIDADEMQAALANLGVDLPMGVLQDDATKTRADWAVQGLPWFILADPKHVVRADDFTFNELDAKLQAIAR